MTELILTTESDGIIDIQMNRPPVNALNLELVEALHQEIDSHTNNGAKGLMLSGREGIYSAGLDVKKLLEMDAGEISIFFKLFWGLMAK
ncbi:MAG: enoyl-CoA hydratase, partial [Gammaproteobacteria bacterium]|nr:enoyl-CoA hydratase [Gammaproteobacteria bacterium]